MFGSVRKLQSKQSFFWGPIRAVERARDDQTAESSKIVGKGKDRSDETARREIQ